MQRKSTDIAYFDNKTNCTGGGERERADRGAVEWEGGGGRGGRRGSWKGSSSSSIWGGKCIIHKGQSHKSWGLCDCICQKKTTQKNNKNKTSTTATSDIVQKSDLEKTIDPWWEIICCYIKQRCMFLYFFFFWFLFASDWFFFTVTVMITISVHLWIKLYICLHKEKQNKPILVSTTLPTQIPWHSKTGLLRDFKTLSQI